MELRGPIFTSQHQNVVRMNQIFDHRRRWLDLIIPHVSSCVVQQYCPDTQTVTRKISSNRCVEDTHARWTNIDTCNDSQTTSFSNPETTPPRSSTTEILLGSCFGVCHSPSLFLVSRGGRYVLFLPISYWSKWGFNCRNKFIIMCSFFLYRLRASLCTRKISDALLKWEEKQGVRRA